MSHKASEWVSERESELTATCRGSRHSATGADTAACAAVAFPSYPCYPSPSPVPPTSPHYTTPHYTTLHRTTLHCTCKELVQIKWTPNSSVPHDTKWHQWRIWYWLYFCGTLRYWTLNNHAMRRCDAGYEIQKIWKQRIWVSRAGINLASSSCLWGF
jgi:hypothetical protein